MEHLHSLFNASSTLWASSRHVDVWCCSPLFSFGHVDICSIRHVDIVASLSFHVSSSLDVVKAVMGL